MKNIFAGIGVRCQFVQIIYDELMKREFITLADILCIYHKRDRGYYDKMSLCNEAGYGELKKAFLDVRGALNAFSLGCIEDNGKVGKGKAFRYIGENDGENLEVVSPQPLRDQIVETLKKLMNQYKEGKTFVRNG